MCQIEKSGFKSNHNRKFQDRLNKIKTRQDQIFVECNDMHFTLNS